MGQFEGGQVGKTKDMNWKKEIDRFCFTNARFG
jgi:hypothetical protein